MYLSFCAAPDASPIGSMAVGMVDARVVGQLLPRLSERASSAVRRCDDRHRGPALPHSACAGRRALERTPHEASRWHGAH